MRRDYADNPQRVIEEEAAVQWIAEAAEAKERSRIPIVRFVQQIYRLLAPWVSKRAAGREAAREFISGQRAKMISRLIIKELRKRGLDTSRGARRSRVPSPRSDDAPAL